MLSDKSVPNRTRELRILEAVAVCCCRQQIICSVDHVLCENMAQVSYKAVYVTELSVMRGLCVVFSYD